MTIKISITDKRPTVDGSPVIICGNSGYVIEFTFDAEWDSLPTKTARFRWVTPQGLQHDDVSFTGSSVSVPVLSGIQEVEVGVFVEKLYATTPATIPCEYSARCEI